MPVGLPKIGGAFSSGGPQKGAYHVKVSDAQVCEAKEVKEEEGRTQKRLGYALQFDVYDDPNHPAKNGKKLTKEQFWLPDAEDDDDKRKTMNGMLKRGPFDGLGVRWPEKEEEFDPRDFIGKTGYVLVDEQEDKRDNSMRTRVVAIRQDPSKLPKLKEAKAAAGGKSDEKKGGAAAAGGGRKRR